MVIVRNLEFSITAPLTPIAYNPTYGANAYFNGAFLPMSDFYTIARITRNSTRFIPVSQWTGSQMEAYPRW